MGNTCCCSSSTVCEQRAALCSGAPAARTAATYLRTHTRAHTLSSAPVVIRAQAHVVAARLDLLEVGGADGAVVADCNLVPLACAVVNQRKRAWSAAGRGPGVRSGKKGSGTPALVSRQQAVTGAAAAAARGQLPAASLALLPDPAHHRCRAHLEASAAEQGCSCKPSSSCSAPWGRAGRWPASTASLCAFMSCSACQSGLGTL